MPRGQVVASKSTGLVNLIYEAVLDVSGWQAFLDAYVEAVGGWRAALLLNDGHQSRTVPFRWSGWPDPDVGLSADRRTAENLCLAVGELEPEGAIRAIDLLCPGEVSGRSPAYVEFCARRDVRYCLEGIVLRTWEIPSLIVCGAGGTGWPFRRASGGDSSPVDAASPASRPAPERVVRAASETGGMYFLPGPLSISIPTDRYEAPSPLLECRRKPDQRPEGRHCGQVRPALGEVPCRPSRVGQSHREGRHPRRVTAPHPSAAAFA